MTDHDAHAWVEAWFAGYGWLTFDPTPGRGTLSADVHERLGLGRRDPGARHRAVPRCRAVRHRPDAAARRGAAGSDDRATRLPVAAARSRSRCSSSRSSGSRSSRAVRRRRRARDVDDPRRRASARTGRARRPSPRPGRRRSPPTRRSVELARRAASASGSAPTRSPPPSRGPATGRRRAPQPPPARRDASWRAILSLLRARLGAGTAAPRLPRGALAAQRLTRSARYER